MIREVIEEVSPSSLSASDLLYVAPSPLHSGLQLFCSLEPHAQESVLMRTYLPQHGQTSCSVFLSNFPRNRTLIQPPLTEYRFILGTARSSLHCGSSQSCE